MNNRVNEIYLEICETYGVHHAPEYDSLMMYASAVLLRVNDTHPEWLDLVKTGIVADIIFDEVLNLNRYDDPLTNITRATNHALARIEGWVIRTGGIV